MRRLAALALCFCACGNSDKVLQVYLITPSNDDPISAAATISMTIGNHTQMAAVNGGHYNLSFTLNTGTSAQVLPVVVEAKDGAGQLVARGQSPALAIAPANGNVFVYVARPGSIGSPTAPGGGSTTVTPRSRHAAVYYPGLGVFLAGGIAQGGQPTDSISLWFNYELIETSNPDTFKLGLARSDLSAGYDGTNFFIYFVGGTDATGAPTSLAEVMDPTGSIGVPYVRQVTATGMGDVERTQAAAAMGADGFALFGGLGHGNTAQAGAVLFTTGNGSKAVTWTGAVPRLGATATPAFSGTQVVVFGGGPAGQPAAERYSNAMSAVTVDTTGVANRTHHSATLLDDRRLLLVGGTDDTGAPMASATIYDLVQNSFMDLPNFLAHPRSGHTATLAGGELVIAGGAGAGGTLVPEVEVFDRTTLAKLREVTLAAPRIHHSATNAGTESVVFLGGEGADGMPIGLVEIYQPAQ